MTHHSPFYYWKTNFLTLALLSPAFLPLLLSLAISTKLRHLCMNTGVKIVREWLSPRTSIFAIVNKNMKDMMIKKGHISSTILMKFNFRVWIPRTGIKVGSGERNEIPHVDYEHQVFIAAYLALKIG